MTVYAATNLVADAAQVDPAIGVYIDGTYSQALRLGADNVLTGMTFSLNGAAHTVELWSSYQQLGGGNVEATCIHNIQWTGGAGVTILGDGSPSRRLVVYGDSITGGARTSVQPWTTGVPYVDGGWALLTRQNYPGRVSIEQWGARALYSDTAAAGSPGLGSIANTATRLAGLFFGATTRQLIVAMGGVNDWGVNVAGWTAAVYGTNLAALCDAVHAIDPTIQIFYMTTNLTAEEATPNVNGEIIQQFRTAGIAAVAGKATVIDLTLSSVSRGSDAVHPDQTGHIAIFNVTRTALVY